MKVAIYIENGVTQLVLTPENHWEESVTGAVKTGEKHTTIHRGSFYECRGGYFRHEGASDQSLILTVDYRERDDRGIRMANEVAHQE